MRRLLTLVHLHIRDGLPLIHGDEPPRLVVGLALLAAAAKVYDQLLLVAAQGAEDGVEAGLAELAAREEEGRDDDLLRKFATSKHLFPQTPQDTTRIHLHTLSAPAAIHSAALESLMPPPTCSPPGHAARASRAASALPGPSIMTWAPRRSLSR